MKLSDVKGERTLDVIAEIIDPIANIAQSEAAKELFKKQVIPADVDKKAFLVNRMRRTIPDLLKGNKKDILSIMAAIEGKPYGEFVEGVDLVSFTVDMVELLSDDAFVQLFTRAQTDGQSGSVQANTKEH